MMTNNEKLALARACELKTYILYGDVFLEDDEHHLDPFNPEHDANQCHECWDRLIWMETQITTSPTSTTIDFDVRLRDLHRVESGTLLSAMTAAMIQLPEVQVLLKEIEG